MIQDRVRLPRKLSKTVSSGVIAEAGRLHPVGSLTITLNMLPLSRVTMTLAESDLDLAMHDFVEVYNQNGSVGVYRVSKITNTYRKERKIELSHGLDVFSDAHFDVIEDYSGTVAGFLARIIAAQTQMIGGVKCWQLGTCADTNAWTKEIRYDNLMTCLTDIAKAEEDYIFTFDQSSFPWTLNFVRREDAFASEFRLRRNTSSCSVAVDDADLCTRLYVSATDDSDDESSSGGISEGYYTFNDTASQAVYGIVAKTVGVNTNDFASAAALEAWAADYFSRHNSPTVQISIDGMELNRLTGESIDEMHIGKICRVALPEYDTVFNERIVSVTYTDALRLPTSISVSLANKRETAEDAFATISNTASSASKTASSARSSSKSAKKKVGEIITQLEVMEEEIYSSVYSANSEIYSYIRMTATNIRSEVANTASALGSSIEQTASSIKSEVHAANSELYSFVEQTATSIRSEVANTASALGSSIEQTSESIKSEVHAANSAVYSFVEMTATQIRSEVGNTACGLMSAIIQTASSIRSEVSAANCAIYTYVDITASGIISRIHNQQRQIFTGPDTPGSGSGETVEEGALWIKYPQARTWEEAEDALTWADDPDYNWNELGGSIIYEYINGQWVEKLNEATLAEDAYVEDTAHGLHRTYAAVTIDAEKKAHAYRSEWQQTASMLWNDMEDKAQDLGSRIEQTASQIRTEVHAANSELYSEIKQTATNITHHVEDKANQLSSHIEQTASEIRLSVASAKSEMGSSITQTASQIRSEVHAAKSSLYSSITQTASSIRLEVADARSDLQSSITQTASSIRSEVSAAKSSLYSSIVQTSTQIAAKVGKGDVATQLAVEMGNVSVTGGNLTVDGMVTAAAVKTALANVRDLYISNSVEIEGGVSCDNIDTGSIDATYLTTNTGDADIGGTLDCGALTINGAEAKVLDISLSGNTLTITKTDGTITFSKATSLSGAWSSGTHTVTAKQTNSGTQTTVATHTTNNQIVFDGNSSSNFSVKLQTREGSASTFTDRLSKYCYLVLSGSGRNQSVKAGANSDGSGSVGSISVSSVYDDGWEAAFAKVIVPPAGTGSSITVKWPGASSGNQGSRVYTLQNNGDNEVILTYPDGSGTVTAAKLTHNKWTEGYTAGESAGSSIDYTEISAGSVSTDSGSISGRAYAGAIGRPSARSYVKFSVTVRGTTRLFYITVND